MTKNALYPLLTSPRIIEPIWGGTRLARWLDLPKSHPSRLGEIWQAYDANPIINGALEGQTLAQVARNYGADLVGTRTIARYGADFPLLAKFIDAGDRLSIQVHPDDAYAHAYEAHTGFHGKTEAWYVLDAEPGANIVCGLSQTTSREEFEAAIHTGELETLLHYVPVSPGDVILVPAGTVHAINAGIMLFEIQEKSDLTYRVYDYGRRDSRTGKPRELHLEKALNVIKYDYVTCPKITSLPLESDGTRALLVACPYFALERLMLHADYRAETDPGSFEILTVISGTGTLVWSDGDIALSRGVSLVLPAALGEYTIQNHDAPLQVLRAYVPDLNHGLIEPLRNRGISDSVIDQAIAQDI